MRFLLRLLINAAALWVATKLVSGITAEGDVVTFLAVALVFGLLNALVRPILKLLSCPLMLLTLGLFTFVINALILWLTSALARRFGLDFHVAGFWPAFWGALVVSIVSVLLSVFLGESGPGKSRE
jgi:putative membrane protein